MHSVLVVDDNPAVRQGISFQLEEAGYTVIAVENGEDALEKARASPFNVVLTEQKLPRMSGTELTKALRALPLHKRTVIFVLTTENSDRLKLAGRAAGVNAWLIKPFDPAKLVGVISQILGVPTPSPA